MQRFDPVGVAASSPGECMRIQLGQYDPETPHLAKAMVLVDKYLEQLAKRAEPYLYLILGEIERRGLPTATY